MRRVAPAIRRASGSMTVPLSAISAPRDARTPQGSAPVDAPFIFLNLLERDAQFPAQLCLAHIKREPLLAHPSADVSVDGACASWRELFQFCSFHGLIHQRRIGNSLEGQRRLNEPEI